MDFGRVARPGDSVSVTCLSYKPSEDSEFIVGCVFSRKSGWCCAGAFTTCAIEMCRFCLVAAPAPSRVSPEFFSARL